LELHILSSGAVLHVLLSAALALHILMRDGACPRSPPPYACWLPHPVNWEPSISGMSCALPPHPEMRLATALLRNAWLASQSAAFRLRPSLPGDPSNAPMLHSSRKAACRSCQKRPV
jgi:hypothetical protein